jgi:hypothetical protein
MERFVRRAVDVDAAGQCVGRIVAKGHRLRSSGLPQIAGHGFTHQRRKARTAPARFVGECIVGFPRQPQVGGDDLLHNGTTVPQYRTVDKRLGACGHAIAEVTPLHATGYGARVGTRSPDRFCRLSASARSHRQFPAIEVAASTDLVDEHVRVPGALHTNVREASGTVRKSRARGAAEEEAVTNKSRCAFPYVASATATTSVGGWNSIAPMSHAPTRGSPI